MAKDAFDAALAGFGRWIKTTERKLSGDPAADLSELPSLLNLMRDYLGIDGPGDISAHGLTELLLRIYPRKITVLDRSDTEDTIPAVRDFLAYLADSGELTEPSARSLTRELGKIAPRFADAVMDPANWGMARSFVQAMAADGIDISDEAAVDGYLATYNARLAMPDADDDEFYPTDLKEAFGLPDRMPPMRLPPDAELAGLARTVPMIGQLRALAAWLGTGRPVTENGELTGSEAAEAAAVIGIDAPSTADDRALPGMTDLPAVGRMRDVPHLEHLWRLALDSEFIELDDDETRATPGETARAWQDNDDEDVLETWDTLFGIVLGTTLDVAASLDPRRARELDFFGHGAGLAVMLFLAGGEGVQVAEASETIRSAAVAELQPVQAAKAWQSWVRAHGDPTRLLLDQMAGLGAVRISSGDEVARLTSLGKYAIRAQFTESGVEIPLLPPTAEMSAAELIAMADGASEEEFEAETKGWLSHRAPEPAARELLSVAAQSDAASRMLAVAVVTELGAPAGPAWRDALGTLELRGYAKASLAALAGDDLPDLDLEDIAWMLTDGLVVEGLDEMDVAGDDPAALADRLSEAIPAGQELTAFEVMARVPHPRAADVLTVIGRYHPDKKIAKAARKAAYKAASRRQAALDGDRRPAG